MLRRLIGFRWTMENVKASVICLALILITFCAVQYRTQQSLIIAVVVLLISIAYSVYQLNKAVQFKELVKQITKYKKKSE